MVIHADVHNVGSTAITEFINNRATPFLRRINLNLGYHQEKEITFHCLFYPASIRQWFNIAIAHTTVIPKWSILPLIVKRIFIHQNLFHAMKIW